MRIFVFPFSSFLFARRSSRCSVSPPFCFFLYLASVFVFAFLAIFVLCICLFYWLQSPVLLAEWSFDVLENDLKLSVEIESDFLYSHVGVFLMHHDAHSALQGLFLACYSARLLFCFSSVCAPGVLLGFCCSHSIGQNFTASLFDLAIFFFFFVLFVLR